MTEHEEYTFHKPLGFRVKNIRHVPHERTLPTSTEMTVKQVFTRAKAQEMIDYLQAALLSEDEFIVVELSGPSP